MVYLVCYFVLSHGARGQRVSIGRPRLCFVRCVPLNLLLFRLVGSDMDILPPSVSSCGSDGQRPVLASVPDPVRVVFVSVAASIASSVAGSNFEKN